jgi:hypothetical protein
MAMHCVDDVMCASLTTIQYSVFADRLTAAGAADAMYRVG